MFELSTSYLNASGWMVDSCMATNGEEAMLPCFSVQWHEQLECLLVDGGFGGACSEREREGGKARGHFGSSLKGLSKVSPSSAEGTSSASR